MSRQLTQLVLAAEICPKEYTRPQVDLARRTRYKGSASIKTVPFFDECPKIASELRTSLTCKFSSSKCKFESLTCHHHHESSGRQAFRSAKTKPNKDDTGPLIHRRAHSTKAKARPGSSRGYWKSEAQFSLPLWGWMV